MDKRSERNIGLSGRNLEITKTVLKLTKQRARISGDIANSIASVNK